MIRSFIICGPQSSGNRLLAGILVRAGIGGTSSTEQPVDYNVDWSRPIVIINHWERVREWIAQMIRHGHSPTLLIPIRETHAMASSMLKRGHDTDYAHALNHRNRVVASNLVTALITGVEAELVVYETLKDPEVVRELLKRHQLRFDNLDQPLNLVGQLAPSQPENLNGKHYVRDQDHGGQPDSPPAA